MCADSPATLWFLYVVRCADGTLYTGISTDVGRRVAEHRGTGGRGAKYLRGRGPLRVLGSWPVGSRSRALEAEHRFRRLPKPRKEALLAGGADREALLEAISPGPESP